jgi:hypothetical protein
MLYQQVGNAEHTLLAAHPSIEPCMVDRAGLIAQLDPPYQWRIAGGKQSDPEEW